LNQHETRNGTIQNVPISEIVVGQRKRHLGDVSELAKSIAEIGLLNPITITADKRLVAGYHRLLACKQLGWTTIPAKIVQLDHLKTELAEIDENLIRQELTELEWARHLKRRKEIYEALHPEATGKERKRLGGKLRHGAACETVSQAESFAADTAAKANVTKRAIYYGLQIANEIPEDVQELILDTPLADQKRELLELARKPEEEQRQIAE
jgi:ParB family chromosome partitioning protein